MLVGLLLLVLFICVAMLFTEGLWSNAIMFINVMTAALLTMNYWEPLASWLQLKAPSYFYYWDFLAIWAVFAAAMIVLRLITDRLSRVRMKFRKPVDMVGAVAFSLWTGWIMVSLVLFSLHTAPLARVAMGGGLQPDTPMFFGLGPDRNWLAFVHKQSSTGALRRSEPRVFDQNGAFVWKYAFRRELFEGLTADRTPEAPAAK